MGELRPLQTAEAMRDFAPHLSAIPPRIDLAGSAPGDGAGGDGGAGCEFMWPFCATPLYVGSQPLVLNLTLLNSRAAVSHFARPPRWIPAAGGGNSGHVEVSFTHAARVAPWSGTLGVRVRATAAAAEEEAAAGGWSGEVRGEIEVVLRDGEPPPQPPPQPQ